MKMIEQLLEPLKPFQQICIACIMSVLAHLDVIASIVAVLVLLFQLKVSFYKGKREKAAYDKECKGE
ncbi:MAG: hypothetical protein MI862_23630 [Desulfobacterales bacterium]|nr:hypothetical protein [Desulfobacterales bacterium]